MFDSILVMNMLPKKEKKIISNVHDHLILFKPNQRQRSPITFFLNFEEFGALMMEASLQVSCF